MDLNGPLFDVALTSSIVADLMADIEQTVSDKALSLVQGRLMSVIREPTPWYWTQIENVRRRGGIETTGESVIYHWWLEGVGSRNFPVTRFKGYHTFQLTTLAVRAQADALAQGVMTPHVRRLGGA